MQLDQIKRELSADRKPEELLTAQRRLLEEEKKRIDRTLAFVDHQQRMLALYQKHGLNKLFSDECCSECEIIRKLEPKEIAVRMEYDELSMAIEYGDDPEIYMVKMKKTGVYKRIAAVFLSGEHRIRRRQKIFVEMMKQQNYSCKSLICSESYCLVDDAEIYFMWCETDE